MGAEKSWDDDDGVVLEDFFDLPAREGDFAVFVKTEACLMNVEADRRRTKFFEMQCQKRDRVKLSRRPEEIEGARIRLRSRVAGVPF
jgi:hypothetical protein